MASLANDNGASERRGYKLSGQWISSIDHHHNNGGLSVMGRTLLLAGLAASFTLSLLSMASASVRAKTKQSGTLKLGYRENSIPSSFVGDDKQPRSKQGS